MQGQARDIFDVAIARALSTVLMEQPVGVLFVHGMARSKHVKLSNGLFRFALRQAVPTLRLFNVNYPVNIVMEFYTDARIWSTSTKKTRNV